jgi:hypothetical protein
LTYGYVIPEIYYPNGCCAVRWANIARYGSSQSPYGFNRFDGAFTENALVPSSLTNPDATTVFQGQLNTTPPGAPNVSQTLGAGSDISKIAD